MFLGDGLRTVHDLSSRGRKNKPKDGRSKFTVDDVEKSSFSLLIILVSHSKVVTFLDIHDHEDGSENYFPN